MDSPRRSIRFVAILFCVALLVISVKAHHKEARSAGSSYIHHELGRLPDCDNAFSKGDSNSRLHSLLHQYSNFSDEWCQSSCRTSLDAGCANTEDPLSCVEHAVKRAAGHTQPCVIPTVVPTPTPTVDPIPDNLVPVCDKATAAETGDSVDFDVTDAWCQEQCRNLYAPVPSLYKEMFMPPIVACNIPWVLSDVTPTTTVAPTTTTVAPTTTTVAPTTTTPPPMSVVPGMTEITTVAPPTTAAPQPPIPEFVPDCSRAAASNLPFPEADEMCRQKCEQLYGSFPLSQGAARENSENESFLLCTIPWFKAESTL